MLAHAMKAIAEFQNLIKQGQQCRISKMMPVPWRDKTILHSISNTLKEQSKWMMDEYLLTKDLRLLRMHLMLEELSEIVYALYSSNEIDLLDGLADMLVVTLGTGYAFELPLNEAFNEVHASNMTKSPEIPLGEPNRFKGERYRAPNLRKLLKE